MKTLRNAKCLLIAVGAILTLTATPPPARAEVVTNVSVPFFFPVIVPCANGGAGEVVLLTGDLHMLLRITADNNGGLHVKMHVQPQGVSGVGMTTGAKYQATGVAQEEFNVKVGIEDTFVNNFRIIGQGPGNNLLVHENAHFTINANGDVTASVDNFSIDCK
jgi:hypothetical protein